MGDIISILIFYLVMRAVISALRAFFGGEERNVFDKRVQTSLLDLPSVEKVQEIERLP